MAGGLSLLHEDVTMCAYFAFVGVIMPFPLLFRLKFRFTNRTMLLTASLTLAACNVLAALAPPPVLCVLCFVAGFMKLWGTFECMSNIQLWMTPQRDFTVFFPLLYIIVLGDIQLSSAVATWVAVRQLYGLAALGACVLTGLLLLCDTPVRSTLKRMPSFEGLGHRFVRRFARERRASRLRRRRLTTSA